MSRTILFIGGVGGHSSFGGELTKNKEFLHYLKENGFHLRVVDTYQARKHLWKLMSLPLLLLRFPRAKLVISTSLGNIYWLIRYFSIIKSKRRIVYWGIGGMFPSQVESGGFDRNVLSILDTIVVEGEAMRQTLLRCGLENVLVVPNFKTIPTVVHRKQVPTDSELIRFVFLSRIQPEKGVGYILDAVDVLNGIPECQGRFTVDFYGGIDPGYETNFRTRLSKLGNVTYKGKLDLRSTQGYECLSTYHVMLFPTYWAGEGFPGVVIDAYIAGLPIIASDWSLNKEFIADGETGVIIPVHNLQALVDAMMSFITHKRDFSGMFSACAQKAWDFSVSNVLTPEVLAILN